MKMKTSYNNDVEDRGKWGLQNKTTSPETTLPQEMNWCAWELWHIPKNLKFYYNKMDFGLLSSICIFLPLI